MRKVLILLKSLGFLLITQLKKADFTAFSEVISYDCMDK